MAEDDDDFSFGDFKFAPPPLQSQSHVNGVTSTSNNNDIWGNFFIPPQSSSSQFQSNNGFSSNPSNSTQPKSPIRADPSPNKFQKPKGALPLSLFGEVEEEEGGSNDNTNDDANGSFVPNPPSQNGKLGSNNNDDGGLTKSDNGLGLNFNGVTSDLIFGGDKNDNDDDDDDDGEWEFKGAFPSGNANGSTEEGNFKGDSVVSGSKVEPLTMIQQEKQAGQYASSSIDFKPDSISFAPQSSNLFAASYGNGMNHQSSGLDIGFNSTTSTPQSSDLFAASYGNGMNHQSSGLDVGFNSTTSSPQFSDLFAASYGNGMNHQSSGLDVGFNSTTSPPQSNDLFAASYGNGLNHQSNGLDVGFNSTTSAANGFTWDPFPRVESIGNGNGNGNEMDAGSINQDDDYDNFGDFIDASQAVLKEQEQVAVGMNHAEAQLPNGEVQERQTGCARGALPLSFFSDDTEESNDGLNLQNEVVHIATPSPGNSFSGQGSNSVTSINDLISKLYSQAQLTSPANSIGTPTESGVHFPQKVMGTTPSGGVDDLDGGSWEFKGAVLENGVGEQLSTSLPGIMAQKQPGIFPELHDYTEFYDRLRDSLCSLLSSQLDELKKSQSSGTVTANGGNLEAFDGEIQEAFKLLEESLNSKEVLAKKDIQRDSSLDKLLEVLKEPKFNVIDSDFQLSRRLQLAMKEWRVALELLQHAISMLKIISLGSADEQASYASTWYNIINVCALELRHGASIWKKASEMNAQHQILLDSQGKQNILALGEIYKVVKLIGLSAKVYKPFVLPNVSNFPQFLGVLDECDALWSKLGLEEAIKRLSNNVDFGRSETAEALITSIRNILDIDTVAVHNCVFIQHKSICQLSLLPEEMLADLKTVLWGEKAYFLNLANLWANLISCDPPQLPHLQVS